MLRYLAGLATGTAATTAGLWLLVAPFALGHAHPRIGRPAAIDLMAGAVITTLGLLTIAAWTTAWRDRLRADGILRRKRPPRPPRTRRPRRQREEHPARTRGPQPDHATAPAHSGAVPTATPPGPTTEDLRELLAPLVAALTAQQPAPPPPDPRPEFRYEPPPTRHPDARGHETRSHDARGHDAHGSDVGGSGPRSHDTRGPERAGSDGGLNDGGGRPEVRGRAHGDGTATRPRPCPPHPRGADDPEEAW